MKNAVAYVRVSTRGQNYEEQVESIRSFAEFRKLNMLKLFADKASGKNIERDGYTALVDAIKKNTLGIEAVVITKVDRVGRKLKDLLDFVALCEENHIDFIAVQNNIDTSTPQGRMYLGFMGVIAEYEREMIIDRTSIGRKRYVEKGGKFGPKPMRFPMDELRRLYDEKVPVKELARRFRCTTPTVYKNLKTLGYVFKPHVVRRRKANV